MRKMRRETLYPTNPEISWTYCILIVWHLWRVQSV